MLNQRMFILSIFTALHYFVMSPAMAVICENYDGDATAVTFNLDDTISSDNNTVGSTVSISKTSIGSVYAICEKTGSSSIRSYRSYVSALNVEETLDSYQMLKVNDYLEAGMSITDSSAGTFYPPENYVTMGGSSNVAKGKKFEIKDSNLVLRLKVIKKIVGTIYIPETRLFTVYVTTDTTDALSTPVYYIDIGGEINVPQSCEINSGDTIDIDFGSVVASAFKNAGAGNKPDSVSEKNFSLSIACDNVDTTSTLTLRVEADSTSGNAILSSSDDIGFYIADSSNNVLTPNDTTSTVGFSLNSSSTASLTMKAWPVSITGNAPEAGEYQATGYLRIDFE